MAEEKKSSNFSDVYNCFLSKVTDDMYLELTPADTLKDPNGVYTGVRVSQSLFRL